MIRVMVTYPNKPGARFDETYYLTKHMPLVEAKLTGHGLKSWSVDKGIGGVMPGSQPDFLYQAHMVFESPAAMQAGLSAEAPGLMADIPNFTDIQPNVQIYQVLA
jgi:uncharacterized protein (TIGR02118 family)